ncbi:hypothetical protein NP233_g12426 [Leucocoprinus birnbaumii]|uniref:NACHT domain-containing protein n=1 Tax=Leucocoprinus birnbaumii TaxID=56174 RepID=A0AAD5VEM3_9AGAR|nr:hypothetical protein NP233_g12426 [Leucocoprinus birnbaumii]
MPAHFLENAHNVVVSNSYFIDNSQGTSAVTGAGLQVLLDASIPEAAHDSFARYPPSRCHPATRTDYIEEILAWGQRADHTAESRRLLWLKGPAGVGKSAIAQTCAESLGQRLAAAFFFSRPNARDDPNRFFTTIAYQLATNHKPYREILDALLRDNLSLVTKSIHQQFQHLIATPIRQLVEQGFVFEGQIIIIDGLDECQGHDFQRDIVQIIANSLKNSICDYMEITVTRDDDQELRQYLKDGLGEVQLTHSLLSSWLSDDDLEKLVELAAGLFIYAATVLRFIGQPSPSGPEGQLRAVLALYEHTFNGSSPRFNSKHPLSELDTFYTLIMQQIPQEILPVTLKILLATAYFPRYRDVPPAIEIAKVLGLSESQLRNALCQHLQSVLTLVTIKPREGAPELVIRFYHNSFMEFLHDESRSGSLSLFHAVVPLRKDILDWLTLRNKSLQVASRSSEKRAVQSEMYRGAFRCLLRLCISFPIRQDIHTLRSLRDFDYSISWSQGQWYGVDLSLLFANIPKLHRSTIIRPYWSLSQIGRRFLRNTDRLYTLGNGKGKVLVKVEGAKQGSKLELLPRSPMARCIDFFCRLTLLPRPAAVLDTESIYFCSSRLLTYTFGRAFGNQPYSKLYIVRVSESVSRLGTWSRI